MSFLTALIGGSAAKPIEAIGNVVDKLFTSDEERLDKKIILERLSQQPALAQAEINKVEASHRSIFVAGWRPAIGWICAASLAYVFLLGPSLHQVFGLPIVKVDGGVVFDLVIAMLGMGTLRSFEKLKGKAK